MTTGPYLVAEVEDADNTPCTCEACGWTGTADAVDEIEDCALTPGDPSPVGRCPECDWLAYVDRPLRANPLDLRLLEMVCDLEHYLCAIRDETLDGSEPELGKLLQKSAALREAFAQRTEVVQPMAPPHAAPKLWLAVVEHEAVPGAKLKLLAQPAEPTAEQILPHFAGELGLGESLDDLYVNGVFDVTHELQYRGNLQAFTEAADAMVSADALPNNGNGAQGKRMKPEFIELTVRTDSCSSMTDPRKALIRHDRITAIFDVSSHNSAVRARTEVTLEEEADYVNDGDETGGVVRARRCLSVEEDYATVKLRLDAACEAASVP